MRSLQKKGAAQGRLVEKLGQKEGGGLRPAGLSGGGADAREGYGRQWGVQKIPRQGAGGVQLYGEAQCLVQHHRQRHLCNQDGREISHTAHPGSGGPLYSLRRGIDHRRRFACGPAVSVERDFPGFAAFPRPAGTERSGTACGHTEACGHTWSPMRTTRSTGNC